ncbi:MAG: hypothetical protein ABEI06_04505 [Halobacteriaceae archaeon]
MSNKLESQEDDEAKELTDMLDELDLSRRRLLATSAVGMTAMSLSGCVSGGGGGKQQTTKATPEDFVVTSHLYVTHDVGKYKTNGFAASCAPQYQFVPGQRIGIRVGIYKAETGKIVGDKVVKEVTATFDGPSQLPELQIKWAGDNEEHPAQQWAGTLNQKATKGAKPGQYSYTIHVTIPEADIHKLGIITHTFTLLDPSKVPTKTPTSEG